MTQPNPGEFHAFSAICPHRGCAVKRIGDGRVICPCHGSAFRITDGSVATGPAEQPLARRSITVTPTELHIS
ncbi:Rieske (2Fe-2S) protein [Nocardia sp. NPDC051787]|uniref:Rieske (2Fe-2S) protein n=1 Tax=Nocardia sp. NPDC051787 TaxID=3155415 RepID=UPI0034443596